MELKKIADEMHREFMRSSVGQVLPVLFETEEDGFCFGHSDTYLMVKVRASSLRRQIKDVRITKVEGDVLCGECI